MSARRTVSDLLEIVAGFERRALELYRHFAQTFAGNPSAARIWRAMSDAEAGHFAILRLAEDRVPAAGAAAQPDIHFSKGGLEEWESVIKELDAKGRRPGLSAVEGAEITLVWEREELPRLVTLLAALPEPVRRPTAAGMLQGAEEHLRCLKELLKAVGRDPLLPEASQLSEWIERLKVLAVG